MPNIHLSLGILIDYIAQKKAEMDGEEERRRKWYSVRKVDFQFTCDCISDVAVCHRRFPFLVFVCYRLLVALFFTGFLIYFGVDGAKFLGAKFLIYLTDWTYILATCYLLVALVNALCGIPRLRSLCCSSGETLRFQIHWFLLNVTATVSIIVTLVYWAAVRPQMQEKLPVFLDISIHLLPAVVATFDILVTPVVIRFVHVIYPVLYLFVYLVFAVVYWAAGGTDPLGNPFIYPIIDFGNYPGLAALSVVGTLFSALIIQGLLKGLYLLRVRCIDKRQMNAHGHHHHNHETLAVQLDDAPSDAKT